MAVRDGGGCAAFDCRNADRLDVRDVGLGRTPFGSTAFQEDSR